MLKSDEAAMLYKRNVEKELDDGWFKEPASEYRGTPFWAWNGKLKEEILLKQIEAFHAMGLGGFHMHVRFGLEDPYMGKVFFDSVKACIKKANELGMLAWLYDEDRWPSGYAGGIVTAKRALRHKNLVLSETLPEKHIISTENDEDYSQDIEAPILLAVYALKFSEGKLLSYRLVKKEEADKDEKLYYALLYTEPVTGWFNGNSYSDNSYEKTTEKFIESTHCKYKELVGDEFGKSVPCIFSDEPHIQPFLKGGIHWSNDFSSQYEKQYGENIFTRLPELFFEGAFDLDFVYRYYDFISERFACAYADKIGGWCNKNGLLFTGHYLCEESVEGQISCSGDLMRQYRSYSLPGIDMLCDEREYLTAIQAKSVANQYGREGVMCELYGSTNWDFDFRSFKLQGDWLAALGVTVRVPHLAWYSMKGEGKRDYPASIGIQANWYKKFPLIEDHFARLNVCLTRGEEVVKIGVIHPVESGWITNLAGRNKITKQLTELAERLTLDCVNFDFIDESLLKELVSEGSCPLSVGKSRYDVILIPPVETIRSTTLRILEKFVDNGGKIIAMKHCPAFVDGKKDESVRLLWQRITVEENLFAVEAELKKFCPVEITCENGDNMKANMGVCGNERGRLIYRLLKDGEVLWLFVARADKPSEDYLPERFRIFIKGEYSARLFDTQSGETRAFPCEAIEGKTIAEYVFHAQDSLLLCLSRYEENKAEKKVEKIQKKSELIQTERLGKSAQIETDEPNILVLDKAVVRVGGKQVCDEEEILRLDAKTRSYLGMEARDFFSAQPWTYTDKDKTVTQIEVEYCFFSSMEYVGAKLAAELADINGMLFNGERVKTISEGYYVDDAISVLSLPKIRKGVNTLCFHFGYNSQSCLENALILGRFRVRKEGENTFILPHEKVASWERLDEQGFPFYGGNLVYTATLTLKGGGETEITVPHFKGNLIEVYVDEKYRGNILFDPYTCNVGYLSSGEHILKLKLYGNRFNTFGQLHNATAVKWDGAYAWRTQGSEWTYNYRTRPVGILDAPEYTVKQKK